MISLAAHVHLRAMQGHFVRVRREPLEAYLVICDDRAEAIALVRGKLALDAEVGCDVVGGLSDAEVARRGLAARTIIPLL